MGDILVEVLATVAGKHVPTGEATLHTKLLPSPLQLLLLWPWPPPPKQCQKDRDRGSKSESGTLSSLFGHETWGAGCGKSARALRTGLKQEEAQRPARYAIQICKRWAPAGVRLFDRLRNQALKLEKDMCRRNSSMHPSSIPAEVSLLCPTRIYPCSAQPHVPEV